MEEVKPEKGKTAKIYIIICRYLEEIMRHCIKILRISFNQSKLYKVEIKKMEYQEDENYRPGPDHEL